MSKSNRGVHNKKTQPKFNNKSTKKQLPISSSKPSRNRKLEIKFDPEARIKYLTTLSEKKKERRAFGLAMQKIKDRKAKLERRKENKKVQLEQVEELERNKRISQFGEDTDIINDNDSTCVDDETKPMHGTNVATFQDDLTKSQFGGNVIVTTTFLSSDDDNDDDADSTDKPYTKTKSNGVDQEQRYAGSVKKYMTQLLGNMPSKKHQKTHHNSKGKHGASNMKGMGGAKDLKLAQKTLSKAKEKLGSSKGTTPHRHQHRKHRR